MVNDITLLKELNALGAVGGNPFDYFEDTGIEEVALYGNDELVSLVWTYGYWSKVKVKHLFGDQNQDMPVYVGELTRSSLLHINTELPPSGIPIVLLDKPKISLKNTITVKELIAYSRLKRMLLDKLLKYQTENPGIKILLFGLPSLYYVKNKIDYERKLIACNGNIIIEKEEICRYLANITGDVGYGEKIFKNAVFSTCIKEDASFLVDKNSEYANVENGHRVVPNVPKEYEHTIYTFGNSLCMGMYTDDEHTIQYQLQDRLNEYQANRQICRKPCKTRGGV